MLNIKDIKVACGRITVLDDNGVEWLGTGYLIAADRAVTCAHVIEHMGMRGIQIDFHGTMRHATKEKADENSDCAILRLDESLTDRQPLRLGGVCKWKAPWDGYGYPKVAKGSGHTISGIVNDPDALDDKQTRVLELTAPIVAAGMAAPIHGFSGSPVLVDGVVVGHLKRYLADPNDEERPAYGTVYATRVECVWGLLGGEPHDSPPPPLGPPPAGSMAARRHANKINTLLAKWTEKGIHTDQSGLVSAESLIQLGEPKQALEILRNAPPSLRADQLRGLALAKTGTQSNIDASIKILKKLQKTGHLDEETGGILAGRYKQIWQRTGEKRYLQQSFNVYLDTFERTKNSYPGINAAATALWLKKPTESKKLARQVLHGFKKIAPEQMDHWQLATMGEAYLLTGNVDEARRWYRKSVECCSQAKESVETMQRQAQFNLKSIGLAENAIDDVFCQK